VELARRALAHSTDRAEKILQSARHRVRNLIELALLRDAKVVAGTTAQLSRIAAKLDFADRSRRLSGPRERILLADEAAMLDLTDVVRMSLCKPDNTILLGDHLQTPPYTARPLSDSDPMPSFFVLRKKMQDTGPHPLPMLRVQHRMPAAVCRAVSDAFYGGRLVTPAARIEQDLNPATYPLLLVDTQDVGGQLVDGFNDQVSDAGDTSDSPIPDGYVNPAVCKTARELAVDFRLLHPCFKVGVACIYRMQCRALERELADEGIQVGTFSFWQGNETDILIFAPARSTCSRLSDFQDSDCVVNVLVSRVRHCFVLIAPGAIYRRSRVWSRLLPSFLRVDVGFLQQQQGLQVTGPRGIPVLPCKTCLRDLPIFTFSSKTRRAYGLNTLEAGSASCSMCTVKLQADRR